MEKKFKIVNSFIISAIITVVFITAITIFADLKPLLKDWLKDNFYHHWVGKGILASMIFVIFGFLIYFFPLGSGSGKIKISAIILFLTAILASLAILCFYIIETF